MTLALDCTPPPSSSLPWLTAFYSFLYFPHRLTQHNYLFHFSSLLLLRTSLFLFLVFIVFFFLALLTTLFTLIFPILVLYDVSFLIVFSQQRLTIPFPGP